MDRTKRVLIRRLEGDRVESIEDTLVVEQNVALEVNGELVIRTTCSPGGLREWAFGVLFSEGWISRPEDVKVLGEDAGFVTVELSSSGPASLRPVDSDLVVERNRLRKLAAEAGERATVFRETGGTHAMGVVDGTGIRTLVEDISRTCALEKAIGEALIAGVDFGQSFSVLSSRVPFRMVRKLARCGIPIVAAVSAPTAEAVDLAEELGICLCGFVRCDRMNVYSHGWRIGL